MAYPPDDPPDQAAILDVSSQRLVDLVHSRDPALIASIRELAALLGRSSEVRQGWSSAISVD
jgi:predicted transcriptional regulator